MKNPYLPDPKPEEEKDLINMQGRVDRKLHAKVLIELGRRRMSWSEYLTFVSEQFLSAAQAEKKKKP